MQKISAAVALFLVMVSWPALAANQYLWIEANSGAEYSPIVVKSDLKASNKIYLAPWKHGNYGQRSLANGLISFEVFIPEAGEYHLWGRVRLPSSGTQPYDIGVGQPDPHNNNQWTRWRADNRSTSEVRNWGWSDSGFRRYFSRGLHTVNLIQTAGGPDVHLDKILLTNDTQYRPSGVGGKEPVVNIENPYRSNAVERHGQLRVQGNQLVDSSGKAIQLRGISAHGLQWFPLVERQTIPNVAEFFGVEAVRLAMYIEDYSPADPSDFWGGYMADRQSMLARTEAAIEDAVRAGLYVLVDWHIHDIPSRYTQEAVEFFTHIARKYGHLPNIIYEICNEPVAVTWSQGIKPYANTVISAIRKHDPNNIVIVGTPNWSQDVDEAARDPLNFSNIMYAFHFYAATHDFNQMRNKVETALNAGLAVFVSEWGSSDVGTSRSNYQVAQQWMDYMNQRKLSWINWSLGNKDESSSILKPTAPMAGPWTDSDLTQAGRWLKPYFNAPQASSGGSTESASTTSSTTTSKSAPKATEIKAGSYARVAAGAVQRINSGNGVGYFDVGDHVVYSSVPLDGVTKVVLRLASGLSGGALELRVGSANGALLASHNVNTVSGWDKYYEVTLNVSNPQTGTKDLFLVGRSGNGIANLDRITLVADGDSTQTSTTTSTTSTTTATSTSSSESVDASIVGGLRCEFVENKWNGGFQHNLIITNTGGSAVNNWQVLVDMGDSGRFTGGWSAQFAPNGSRLTVSGLSGQTTLQAGQSVTVGFQGTWSGNYQSPRCL